MDLAKIITGKKCLLIIFVLIIILIYCIINQKEFEIVITLKKIDLLKHPEKTRYADDVITILDKGIIGKILYSKCSKDYIFYKIRLENGTEGWILGDLGKIKLIDFKKKNQ